MRHILQETHRPQQSPLAVVHRRGAEPEGPLGTVHRQREHGGDALAGHRLLRAERFRHRHRELIPAGDRLDRSPGVAAPGQNLLRGWIEPGHRPLRVGDDDRIIEGVDRRLGGLLGDEEPTEIRAAHRPDPLGHPVEVPRELPDFILRGDLGRGVEVPAGDSGGRGPQDAERPDDAVGEEQREEEPGDHQRGRDPERRGNQRYATRVAASALATMACWLI